MFHNEEGSNYNHLLKCHLSSPVLLTMILNSAFRSFLPIAELDAVSLERKNPSVPRI